ncbi:transporter substrate-binding domain-containing protein [Maridesulfovibrio sp.]|uniref:transporter substrate-binding domain-containing protein n=1 Tax=Maridesulfovibrio sp. TaxID=2795000 RepID=UPI003BAC8156
MNKSIKIILITIAATLILLPANLAASTPLTITLSRSMPPLSFMNSAGEPDGLLIDFWREWALQADRDIIFKMQTWRETIQDTISGKADIHGGLFYSEKRARNLLFADYIFPMETALFAPRKLIEANKINLQSTPCGLVKGGYGKEFMSRTYPYTQLAIFNSIADLFKAVKEERIALFLMDYPVAVWQLEHMGLTDSFYCFKKLYKMDLYPAVSKTNTDLVKIINLNMAAIPPKKKKAIINKWLAMPGKGYNYRTIAAILTSLVLVVMGYVHRNELKAMLKIIKK